MFESVLTPGRASRRAVLAFAFTCGLTGSLFALPSTSEAAAIQISPQTSTVDLGDTFTLNLDVDAVDLFAFQVTILFEETILQASSPTEGAFLLAGGATLFFEGVVDNTAGSITFLGNSLSGPVPGVSGIGTLATLTFTAVGTGTSPVTLVLDPVNVDVLLDSALNELATQTLSGSVTVTAAAAEPIPEPATLALMLVGCSALAARRRRRLR